MREHTSMSIALIARGLRVARAISRWREDHSGTTAVEFAIVGMPFLMFLYGIIGIGLYFTTMFTLENGLEQASRLIRTGQAQKAGMTDVQFKNVVCSYIPGCVDCQNKLLVNVRSFAEADMTPTIGRAECLNNGSLTNLTTYQPGTANQVVLVTLCFEWELGNKIPFIRLGDMSNGSRLIQAAAVFRTEPYPD
jgi:Flp pilus assembly protein TadG